jgi:DNA (cytosine-5)-methyltransferase 1
VVWRPQNRERVFIVGHLGGEPTRTVFPITEIGEPPFTGDGEGQQTAHAIDGNYFKGADNHAQRTLIWGNPRNYKRNGFYEENDVYHAVRAAERPLPPGYSVIQPVLTPDRPEKSVVVYEQPHGNMGGEINLPNLREKNQHTQVLIHRRIRRLTPLECERLQGFPDEWTKFGYAAGKVVDKEPIYGEVPDGTDDDGEPAFKTAVTSWSHYQTPVKDAVLISDTQRYKMMGNAITVNVIRLLARRIRDVITPKS